MDKEKQRAIISIPIIIIVAAGLAVVGSLSSSKVFGIPLFAICVVLVFLIQWIEFIPSFRNQTEEFFDLTSTITYVTVTVVAVLLNPTFDGRSLLLQAVITIWAIRLGFFLFRRTYAAGGNRRLLAIKTSLSRFLMTFTLQGLWVSITMAAALTAITSVTRVNLGVYALVGFLVWLLGFVIEVVSDDQKSKFKADPKNAGKFIDVGLWSWSRHPNYFGEILLWIGVAIIAWPVLSGWTWLMLISPLFVLVLLTWINGVPRLEKRADEKWGGQDAYEAYKARTSVLIPFPPKAQN